MQIDGLTVVTNSLAVANVLERAIVHRGRGWVELILTGGSQSESGALVGPTAIAALERVNPAVLFLSVDGADETIGLSTNDVLEAEVNKAFLRSARQRIVLVAGGQWGSPTTRSWPLRRPVASRSRSARFPARASRLGGGATRGLTKHYLD